MDSKKYLILLGLLSIPVIYPLTGGGYILTHDQYFPIHRLIALDRIFSEYQIPPRWTDLFALGHGYPFFNFYAPLAYYLAYLVYLLSREPVLSIHLIFGFGLIFGGFGAYFWIKNIFNKKIGFIAGLIYIYLPYHLVNAYVRGNISELLASAFFPWVIWSIHHLNLFPIKTSDRKEYYQKYIWLIITAIFYACTILSHNIMALLFTKFFLIYILFLFFLHKNLILFIQTIFACFIGLGISAYFWLPAFIEKKYIQVANLLYDAKYYDHYVYPWQFISLRWGYGGSVSGAGDEMSFQLGIVAVCLTLISIGYIFRTKSRNVRLYRYALFHIALLFIYLILMLPVSRILWEIIPLIKHTLYPWRFLSLTGIPLTFLSGLAVYLITKRFRINKTQHIILLLLTILIILVTIPYLEKRQIQFQMKLIQPENIWKTEMVSRTFGTTMSNEYLPIWVKIFPEYPSREFVRTNNNQFVHYRMIEYSSIYQKYEIYLSQNANLEFALFYFPGWEIRLNGNNIDIQVTQNGFLSAELPKGNHQLELIFTNTKIRYWSNRISIASLLIVLWLAVYPGIRKKQLIK